MNATDNQNRAALLDRAAVHARFAQEAASLAGTLMRRDLEAAQEQARAAQKEALSVVTLLCGELGATIPGVCTNGKPARPAPLDLRALASLDTPDARELLTLLEAAQAVAERVDASRGRTVAPHITLGPNESAGTDFAEEVANTAARLRGEVFGRTGNGEG